MREPSVDLESTLDGLIARLVRAGSAKGAKALALDARRLRTVVGNWRTIEPTDEARKEMTMRVEQLARSADATVPPEAERTSVKTPAPAASPVADGAVRAPAPAAARASVSRRQTTDPVISVRESSISSLPPMTPQVVVARSTPPLIEELTRAAPIATQVHVAEERATVRTNGAGDVVPMRHRTLPDLDISGIAELVDDGAGAGFDDTLDSGRVAGRARRSDVPALRARPASEPPPRNRISSNPPNGKRRTDVGAQARDGGDRSGSERPARGARPSRFLVGPEPGIDGPESLGGPVYRAASPAAAEDAPSPVPARATIEPAAQPVREGRTPIAVRPLPAPDVPDKRLVMLADPYSARADAYRALRRKLSGPGAPRTIAVTSAQPNEGKTSCAVNLALAFRETSNEKILLIEANLRSPSLAATFGFEPPMCFAKQMAKNRDTTRATWTVVEQYEPLHILAIDPAAKNPPLLDPVAFANALEQLVDAGYDHIIVDTAPAIGGSDINLVADAVDGTIVVAWLKKSKKSMVKKAIDQLKPAVILGVVTLDG